MKDIEKVSSGKIKYDSLTGKSVIDASISRFGPYMNKILGISMAILLIRYYRRKCFHLRLTNYQPLTTYSMVSPLMHYLLDTLIKTYHLVILFILNQRMFSIKSQ